VCRAAVILARNGTDQSRATVRPSTIRMVELSQLPEVELRKTVNKQTPNFFTIN